MVTGQRVRESHVLRRIERYLKRETVRDQKRLEDAVNIYKGEFYLLRICQSQV